MNLEEAMGQIVQAEFGAEGREERNGFAKLNTLGAGREGGKRRWGSRLPVQLGALVGWDGWKEWKNKVLMRIRSGNIGKYSLCEWLVCVRCTFPCVLHRFGTRIHH
jgi:hypothetical protein